MKVILDTSFILTCIKQKIDFFENLALGGFEIFIPKQVIQELESLSQTKPEASLALFILEKNKFKELEIPGKKTDSAIINFSKKNSEYVVATLDEEIKKKTRHRRKIVIRGKKGLEIA